VGLGSQAPFWQSSVVHDLYLAWGKTPPFGASVLLIAQTNSDSQPNPKTCPRLNLRSTRCGQYYVTSLGSCSGSPSCSSHLSFCTLQRRQGNELDQSKIMVQTLQMAELRSGPIRGGSGKATHWTMWRGVANDSLHSNPMPCENSREPATVASRTCLWASLDSRFISPRDHSLLLCFWPVVKDCRVLQVCPRDLLRHAVFHFFDILGIVFWARRVGQGASLAGHGGCRHGKLHLIFRFCDCQHAVAKIP
jgi:hypothetical protein